MMARMQVSLDPELQRRARRRANDLGVSLAEYVRGLVAEDLGQRRAPVDPSVVFDLGASPGSDIARDKDRMVAEAVAAERRRGRPRR